MSRLSLIMFRFYTILVLIYSINHYADERFNGQVVRSNQTEQRLHHCVLY